MQSEEKVSRFIKDIGEARKQLLIETDGINLQLALMEYFKLEDPFELLDKDLNVEKIVKILKDFDFSKPTLIEEVSLDESIIPADATRLLCEVKIKHKGEIWKIYKYDKDPFPSNPHAHNEESGLKLHLGNGELFLRRKAVGKIRGKDLLAIRSMIKSDLLKVALD